MEFHGTLVPPNEMSLSSMEFHGFLRLSFYSFPRSFPWTSTEYSMELHGTMESPNKKSQSSMGLHGIRRASYQMTQVFHGIPWNIPWNSMELWYPQMKYNLVIYYLATPEFHEIPWNIPCKSRVTWHWTKWQSQSSMEFPGTKWYFIWRHQSSYRIPWNSIELGDSPFGGTRVPWNFMSLHLPWNFRSFMEFHGTSQLGLGIPWNSMELLTFHGNSWNFSTGYSDSISLFVVLYHVIIYQTIH